MVACAYALAGWKKAEPWSPSITVIVPPGRNTRRTAASAASHRIRQVLEHETDEKVVELSVRERQIVQVSDLEPDIGRGHPGPRDRY